MEDNRVGFNAAYNFPAETYEEMLPLIEYSFGTFSAQSSGASSGPSYPPTPRPTTVPDTLTDAAAELSGGPGAIYVGDLSQLVGIEINSNGTVGRIGVDDPFGPMALYKSAEYPFSIQYPATWFQDQPRPLIAATFRGPDMDDVLTITESLLTYPFTLEEYVDISISVYESTTDYQLLSREQIVTEQGLTVGAFSFTYEDNGPTKATELVYIHEGKEYFRATYLYSEADADQFDPLISYSFYTFRFEEP